MPRGPQALSKADKPTSSAAKKQSRTEGGVTLETCLRVDSPIIRKIEKQKAQRRGFKWALGLILLICFSSLLKIVIQESFLKNPQFELRTVAVDTSGPLTITKIVRASQLTTGDNLLTINMRALHTRLRQLPPVKDVRIERDFERGVLTLRVKQRQPVAWLDCAKQGMIAGRPEVGYLIDAEAVAFPCDVILDSCAHLPVIRYESLPQKSPGLASEDLQLKAALNLLKSLDQRYELGQPQVRMIDIVKPYAMVATFADKAQITFGIDDLELQMARLDRIRIEAQQRGWEIETLNLLVQQNVPVTFRQPPQLAGLQPAPAPSISIPKPTPTR